MLYTSTNANYLQLAHLSEPTYDMSNITYSSVFSLGLNVLKLRKERCSKLLFKFQWLCKILSA